MEDSTISMNITNEKVFRNKYMPPPEEPMYTQFKPTVKHYFMLPNPALYMVLATIVTAGVAYAIVGHLIKDLAIDIAEHVLGPGDEEDSKPRRRPPRAPVPLSTSLSHHNAFHVWDLEEVVVPLPVEESPHGSPLLLAAIPYIPHFFPTHTTSPGTAANTTHSYSPVESNPTHSCSPGNPSHNPSHNYSSVPTAPPNSP